MAEAPLLHLGNDATVGGRLHRFAAAWSGDRWAKSIVTQGLRWEWDPSPPPLRDLIPQRKNVVLEGYVSEMLEKGAVVPFEGQGVQNHLFTRPKKGTDKLRCILNLSRLNDLIPCPSFKMVTVRDVRACLPPSSWMTSLDLSDAYWHIPIAKNYQKYLAFALPMPDGQNTFAFKAMPFGLNIAPRIFTALCAVLVQRLKKGGVQVFAYLDDWLVLAPSEAEARAATAKVRRTLEKAGFILNEGKSKLTPTQTIEWLGWTWRTTDMTISYPPEKVALLRERVTAFVQQTATSIVQVESLVGFLNWVTTVDPIGRIKLKEVIQLQGTLA